MRISQKVNGVIMRNLRGTILYMKNNILQDFDTCISVPLSFIYSITHYEYRCLKNAIRQIASDYEWLLLSALQNLGWFCLST